MARTMSATSPTGRSEVLNPFHAITGAIIAMTMNPHAQFRCGQTIPRRAERPMANGSPATRTPAHPTAREGPKHRR